MVCRSSRRGNGSLPSSVMPFLNVRTDGRAKSRHNAEVRRFLGFLRSDGVKDYRLHHINDAGYAADLPISLDGKFYDIAYRAADGEVFLIEVMRVTNLGKGRCK